MKGYTDMHCHSVMTHYRNPELDKSACDEINKPGLSDALRSTITQSDFGKLVKGNVGGIIISLYPIERKWFLPKTPAPGLIRELVSRITGFSENVVGRLMDEFEEGTLRYYDDLVGEYQYLLSQVDKLCHGKKIKIATSYDEYKTNMESGDTVSVIISIEGGHSLGTIHSDDLVRQPGLVMLEDYTDKYRDNLFSLKKWGPSSDGSHTPFFITLAHHFWNMLVGHSESLLLLFDQKTGKESGFTDAGREMLDDLLSSHDKDGNPEKTRRILVDVKHMSPLARKQYYNHIARIKKNTGLNIPVLSSHSSMGDAKKLNCFIKGSSDYESFKKPDNFFNTSSLSLNEEDVIQIINSDGLIGIILHEGRIASKKAFEKKAYRVNWLRNRIKKAQREIKNMQALLLTDIPEQRKRRLVKAIAARQAKILASEQEMREAYVCMIMANVYKIVETWKDHDADVPAAGWDHICIGSDFDGTINKMDYLGTSEQFKVIEEEMIRFMAQPRPLTGFDSKWKPAYLQTLHFGHEPEVLVTKFMRDNTVNFLKKYFTENYLVKGINPD